MKCTKCMGNTIIVDSRLPDEDRIVPVSKKLIKETKRVWAWWSDDFRARKRKCQDCGYQFFTLEIELSDIEAALQEAAACSGGKTPWEKSEIDTAIEEEREIDDQIYH